MPADPQSPPPSAARPARRATGALARVALLGTVGGFVLGSLILGLLQHNAPGGWSWVDIPFSMAFGGTFGALVGAIGAPATGWLFFRHVPLGRAMLVTGAGTLAGAAIASRRPGGPSSVVASASSPPRCSFASRAPLDVALHLTGGGPRGLPSSGKPRWTPPSLRLHGANR